MIWKIAFACLMLFSGIFNALMGNEVKIDSSRTLFFECSGEGSPSVIFIAGRTDRGAIWNQGENSVFSQVIKFTHACTYDRPGTISIVNHDTVIPSKSTSVKQPTTPQDGVNDLRALLRSAKIQGPYVLVAHSFGGLIARLYASLYPDEVAGLVLIDTLTEQLFDELTPGQQKLWINLNSNYSREIDEYTTQEKTDFQKSFDQMQSAPRLKAMPVTVLTSDQPYDFKKLIHQGILPKETPIDFETVVFQAHLNGQKKLAALLNAKQISDTHAGHYIHTEQPKLVVDTIRSVVEEARHSAIKLP